MQKRWVVRKGLRREASRRTPGSLLEEEKGIPVPWLKFNSSFLPKTTCLALLITIFACISVQKAEAQTTTEGCDFNGTVYIAKATVFRDRSRCMTIKCAKKRGSYSFKLKKDKRCSCQECPAFKCAANSTVCGTDGQTYETACDLKLHKCKTQDEALEAAYDGACDGRECPQGCTKEYKPVCGSDNVTYSNECELKRLNCTAEENIEMTYKGICEEEDCPDVCPEIYAPVCGSDNQTYSNECFLNIANCLLTGEITVQHTGECNETSSPTRKKRGAHYNYIDKEDSFELRERKTRKYTKPRLANKRKLIRGRHTKRRIAAQGKAKVKGCIYEGNTYKKGKTVASFPGHCFDFVCVKQNKTTFHIMMDDSNYPSCVCSKDKKNQ